jgi:hypothetical protein
MTIDDSSRPPRPQAGCFGTLFGCSFLAFWPLAFVPLMFAAVGPVMVPPTAQLAAPVVCPAGYQSSTVRNWSTPGRKENSRSDHYELSCVLADGSQQPASGMATGFTLFGMCSGTMVVPTLFLGGLFLLGRMRRR